MADRSPTPSVVVVSPEQLRELIADAVREALAARATEERSDWIDTAGAAELLHLHPDTVSRRARLGHLPSHRLGREYRFRRSELLAWLAGQSIVRRTCAPS